jgi:hypothetical protein
MTGQTTEAAPCLACGSTGGYTIPGRHKPARPRGLCYTCYHRKNNRGDLADYPRLTNGSKGWRDFTPPPAHVSPWMLGIRPGQPAVHPDVPPWMVAGDMAHSERVAADWLARHPAATPPTWAPGGEVFARFPAAGREVAA